MTARREVVQEFKALSLSERMALKLVGISASVLRYQPRDDGNSKLRERLKELAGQHRRHGYRMLHDRLTRQGWAINVKRTYRLYREEGLMVRQRRRKKLSVPERQPLLLPSQPNEVWGYCRNMRHEVGVIAHSCGVHEPRELRRFHARIVVDNTRSVSLDKLFPEVRAGSALKRVAMPG
ncbi:MAG: IS3 family transposase [Burkholderiaceae bacterium]|nr:IS3 family transposase [Burkholderiaceae bacterium]MDH3459711.1 IS3 family transposase [Burkholderiaceae bacterium]